MLLNQEPSPGIWMPSPNSARITSGSMLIWPFFQPNRRWISECHLDRLDQLMELAAERRIDVCPALLTGWLSGWAFRTTFDRQEGFYAAEKLREPVERYFPRLCGST